MKNYIIFILSLPMIILACQSKDKQETGTRSTQTEKMLTNTESQEINNEIVFHMMGDGKSDKVYGQIPLPANWYVNSSATENQPVIQGPDGINVYFIPYKSYIYTEDANMRQIYQQSGQPFRYPISIKNIINEDLIPVANRDGSKFIRHYDLPDVAEADRNFSSLLFQAVPSQRFFYAVATEWEDAKGDSYLIVIHQNSSIANNTANWNYFCHAMEAPQSEYENAKKNLLYGLAHAEYNPRYFDDYNREEAQKANASWSAHNQRMAANQQRFDAQQQAFTSNRDAINKASMDGYSSRNATSDRNHNRFMNYIKDENTVTEQGGKRYQVESGGNQYWINDNGEYMKSNNQNYDPNRDQNTNNQTWRETKIEN